MIVRPLDHYTPEIANRVRELLIQLSRSGKDKGEIPEDWFNDIINSPWHDRVIGLQVWRIRVVSLEMVKCLVSNLLTVVLLSILMPVMIEVVVT